MNNIHSASCSAATYYRVVGTRKVFQCSFYLHYKPVSSIDKEKASLKLVVPGMSEYYIDLAYKVVFIQEKIVPK